jgi:hypothetical protein
MQVDAARAELSALANYDLRKQNKALDKRGLHGIIVTH